MRPSAETSAIELRAVAWSDGESTFSDVSAVFETGAMHWIHGDAGVNALVRIAALLDLAQSGAIVVEGEDASTLDDAARTILRGRKFGFVFAAPFLLPAMTIAENIAMPLFKVLDLETDEVRLRTNTALAQVGMAEMAAESVALLSWYDQQRVALARAIAHRPAVLVLDRADQTLAPTEATAFFTLARRTAAEFGMTALVVPAHGMGANVGDRVWTVAAGRVAGRAILPAVIEESAS